MPLDLPAEIGCWMQTYSGRIVQPLNPDPASITIEDIAAALSKQCRFAGHVREFYSVAEHSVLVSRHCPEELRLVGLLHDASEAYLTDIPRPLKPQLSEYVTIENMLMRVIGRKFGFDWPMPRSVKDVDNRILSDERTENMAFVDIEPRLWGNVMEGLGVKLRFWSPKEAEFEFIQEFRLLSRMPIDA